MRPSSFCLGRAYERGHPIVAFVPRDDLSDAHASTAARQLLGAVVRDLEPRLADDAVIFRDERGKPHLARRHDQRTPSLAISIAHSTRTIGVAIARTHRVGLDVEPPSSASQRLVRRVFAPADAQRLLTSDDAGEDFARSWTVAEACAKASGRGLPELFDGLDPIGTDVAGRYRGLQWRTHQLPTADMGAVAASGVGPTPCTLAAAHWFELPTVLDSPAIPEGTPLDDAH